jgi:hypothetical protein
MPLQHLEVRFGPLGPARAGRKELRCADLLREMIGFAAQRLTELEVPARTGGLESGW